MRMMFNTRKYVHLGDGKHYKHHLVETQQTAYAPYMITGIAVNLCENMNGYLIDFLCFYQL